MADRFDVMTVWIENVGRKIIRVMFETQARCAIITATGGNRRFVKCLARLKIADADDNVVNHAAVGAMIAFSK
jgi:hypothetical protein